MEEKRKIALEWFNNHFQYRGIYQLKPYENEYELHVFANRKEYFFYALQFDNINHQGKENCFCMVRLYHEFDAIKNIKFSGDLGFPIFCNTIFDLESLLNNLLQ
jgi:hypothetical protein